MGKVFGGLKATSSLAFAFHLASGANGGFIIALMCLDAGLGPMNPADADVALKSAIAGSVGFTKFRYALGRKKAQLIAQGRLPPNF